MYIFNNISEKSSVINKQRIRKMQARHEFVEELRRLLL
jgi:hypothetical protein